MTSVSCCSSYAAAAARGIGFCFFFFQGKFVFGFFESNCPTFLELSKDCTRHTVAPYVVAPAGSSCCCAHWLAGGPQLTPGSVLHPLGRSRRHEQPATGTRISRVWPLGIAKKSAAVIRMTVRSRPVGLGPSVALEWLESRQLTTPHVQHYYSHHTTVSVSVSGGRPARISPLQSSAAQMATRDFILKPLKTRGTNHPDQIRKQGNNGGGRDSEKEKKARERPIARKIGGSFAANSCSVCTSNQ